MKALKYFIVPVIVLPILIGNNVHAATPAYISLSAVSALESGLESFFKTIYYIVMFALILAAAYYSSKFLARKGLVKSKSKTMKLIESMPLGVDKSLYLVQVGTQYFLVGSASKGMLLINELNQDKLVEEELNNAINLQNFDYGDYNDDIEGKDFKTYLNSIKNNLNKLKSIVRGSNNDETK